MDAGLQENACSRRSHKLEFGLEESVSFTENTSRPTQVKTMSVCPSGRINMRIYHLILRLVMIRTFCNCCTMRPNLYPSRL